MDIPTYKSRFSRRTKSGELINSNGACHQAAGYKDTVEFVVEFYKKETDIKLVKRWLQLLKTIDIQAEYKENLTIRGHSYENSIVLNCDKSKKFKKGKTMLFAYQLVRLVIKNTTFVKQVLKNEEKFNKMNAWDLIYLTWNDNPIKDNSWSSYYDAMTRGKTFKYINIKTLLILIEESNSISNILLILSEKIDIDLNKIKNKSLNSQLKKGKIEIIPLICNLVKSFSKEPEFMYENKGYVLRDINSHNSILSTGYSKYVKVKMYLKNNTSICETIKLPKKDLIDFYNKEKKKWEQN